MTASKAYTANHIFTGEQWLQQHAVIVSNGIISGIVPLTSLQHDAELLNFGNSILAPAFIDLQLYGAYGKLLAAYPNTDSLQLLNSYSNTGGAAFCMPTVATNEPGVIHACIDAIRQYWQQGGEGILGLHVEGPWINKEKRGAHIESLVHSPALKDVQNLLQYGKDVIKIITLAPEVCSKDVMEYILASGIRIFAGHSNASYQQAIYSFDNGIAAVTHLYNAMSPLQHRNPGLVGATMDHPKVMASIIPDGFHVDFAAIRIAKKIMHERLFAITDAVTDTTEGYYKHERDGEKYSVGGILSGSALNMYKALQNLVHEVGIETGEAIRMCSLYPAQVMQIDHQLGRIERGYKACMVSLAADLKSADPELVC